MSPADGEQTGDRALWIVQVAVDRVRHAVAAALQFRHDKVEAFGVADGQRLEKDRVHHGEHRGVGSDAEGEQQQCDGGESGTAAHATKRVAEVLEEALEGHPAALLEADFEGRGGVTEGAAGGGAGLVGRHALGDETVGLDLDVALDLAAEVGVHFRLLLGRLPGRGS